MTDINYMAPQEFIDAGLLHEVNRLLLHPLGLALQLNSRPGETSCIMKIWDYRDDREGVYFEANTLSAEKAEAVARRMFERRTARVEELGYVIQPVDTDRPTLTTTYVNVG